MRLGSRFASDFPELSISWQADVPPNPQLLVLNESLADELGLDPAQLRSPAGIGLLTGTLLPADAVPVAQCYAGHQFGGYSPRLGDGRALLLGELSDAAGDTRDLHLKGSGPTPFSRGGDGFAVVGPMLREFIVSEAMHALGIPTTRSLAVVQTGRTVYREDPEKGALLVRVASSHLRVGSFQYARATNDLDLLKRLADHAIARHYPNAASAENPYLELFNQVISVQATLIAQWMLVGFVHGVMNTDNMTISGESIDYGPCAFIDDFNPAAVFSSIDHGGRYKFGNQPVVAEWNLARFAESLLPLFADSQDAAVEHAQDALGKFTPQYSAAWSAGMRKKLGLAEADASSAADIATELFEILKVERADYTSLFRNLADAARGNTVPVTVQLAGSEAFADWLTRWRALDPDAAAMNRVNPLYIPRNHIVEEALAAATAGDMHPVSELLELVTAPYAKQPGKDRFAQAAPDNFGPYRTFCGT
ncbi:protein adenylyltransferase SelO [Gulosibacter chungangensis]|uniref:Protein nucleotidyltransferase YdiU n=1 Tax=Gulosibacter chungangensis TaxID=979746 RepID=A0A7J5BGS0_9MICO|nr:YdiU family protein [Gulosibacter chungangensis]KAB1645318.1 YdiU family protein [Gulosibacter chungangensis]